MNKITCDMYQDLLTLYIDDLCSEDSVKAVSEHLKNCNKCRDAYMLMKNNVKVPTASEQEKQERSEFKSNLTKTWKNYQKATTIKIITAVTILGLLILGWHLSFSRYYTFSGSMVNIENVCMMSDGSIAFEILTYNNREGAVRRIVPFYNDGRYVEMQSKLFGDKKYSEYSSYICVNPGEYDVIYYGNPTDRIVVWEEGMDIPKASEELEEYFSWQNNN